MTAATAIANIVKSSLGPVGLDKMLVDEVGPALYRVELVAASSLVVRQGVQVCCVPSCAAARRGDEQHLPGSLGQPEIVIVPEVKGLTLRYSGILGSRGS